MIERRIITYTPVLLIDGRVLEEEFLEQNIGILSVLFIFSEVLFIFSENAQNYSSFTKSTQDLSEYSKSSQVFQKAPNLLKL